MYLIAEESTRRKCLIQPLTEWCKGFGNETNARKLPPTLVLKMLIKLPKHTSVSLTFNGAVLWNNLLETVTTALTLFKTTECFFSQRKVNDAQEAISSSWSGLNLRINFLSLQALCAAYLTKVHLVSYSKYRMQKGNTLITMTIKIVFAMIPARDSSRSTYRLRLHVWAVTWFKNLFYKRKVKSSKYWTVTSIHVGFNFSFHCFWVW